MKKLMVIACTLVSFCIILVSCGKEDLSQVITEEEVIINEEEEEIQEGKKELSEEEVEEVREELPEIEISVKTIEDNRELKDENGILMVSVTENYPVITNRNNEEASNIINEYYQSQREVLKVMEEEYFAYALEDYSMADEETREYWNGYGLGKTYEITRTDGKVISIVESGYEYAGGAHPNSYKVAQNFDPKTGERLSLEDISIDGDNNNEEYDDEDYNDAKDFMKEYLISYIEGSEYIDYVYPEFRDNIGDIIGDDTWYFSEEGIVIIANAYIIAPYAGGIMEFTIPYQDAVFLKDMYKM